MNRVHSQLSMQNRHRALGLVKRTEDPLVRGFTTAFISKEFRKKTTVRLPITIISAFQKTNRLNCTVVTANRLDLSLRRDIVSVLVHSDWPSPFANEHIDSRFRIFPPERLPFYFFLKVWITWFCKSSSSFMLNSVISLNNEQGVGNSSQPIRPKKLTTFSMSLTK